MCPTDSPHTMELQQLHHLLHRWQNARSAPSKIALTEDLAAGIRSVTRYLERTPVMDARIRFVHAALLQSLKRGKGDNSGEWFVTDRSLFNFAISELDRLTPEKER